MTDWFQGRAAAAFLLLFFLPGWAWLEALSPRPQQGMWRIVFAFGLSFILTTLGTLYLAYIPGSLGEGHVLIACAFLTLPALVVALRRRHPPLTWPDRRLWLLLLLVLVLAAAIRLPRLGYAEFHEDEVEVTSLAVRTIKGEDYAVFLHRKGPAQMLLPLAGWVLAGRINEGWARLPFAAASLLGVLTLTLFAYDLAGWGAGLATGLLVALNGYFIAFGRMVQYQSLVFFLASLALVCLWRVLEESRSEAVWLAAPGLAVSLLAHYDALVYLPVAAYLGWRIWRLRPALRPALLASTALAIMLLLSFYIPYLQDPQFQHTRAYLFENRVGVNWLYNNLKVLSRLDADYSSRFYLPVLAALSLAALVCHRRSIWAWWGVMGAALIATWTSLRWPGAWQMGNLNLAFAPWLVLLVAGGIRLGRHRPGYEALWMWWGVPFLAYVFLVGDPRTHLYVAYPGWAIVAGLGAACIWQSAGQARYFLSLAGAVLAVLVAGYQAVIFLTSESAFLRLREDWDGRAGAALYGSLPKPRSYFGYPKRVGWKAAGWLVATGRFPDDFRSAGEDFSVPIWYTFETPRSCYNDPELYLVARPGDEVYDTLSWQGPDGYVHAATITSEGLPRLGVFLKSETIDTPEIYDLADLEVDFDAAATPDRFAAGGEPVQSLEVRFGQVARLRGFSLGGQPVTAGETLSVSLYWQGIAETDLAYRAFVHLGENPVRGQHDDDPACRLPTTLWRSRQQTVGQFRVAPSPETPPGEYPLVVGLYDPASGERLPVLDEQGQVIADHIVLTTVRVVEPQ